MTYLERVEFYKIQFPFKHAFSTSFGSFKERDIIIVRVIDKDGCEGIGESSALDGALYKPEFHNQVILSIKELFFPILIRTPINSVEDFDARIERVIGQYFAKSALSLAMYDLLAKRANQDICNFLKIQKRDVILSKTFSVATDVKHLIDEAQTAWDEGIRFFKLKIKPGCDYDPTKALREYFPDAELMCDANASYEFRQDNLLESLKPFDLLCIEQPFTGVDLVHHAKFHQKSGIPLALDESIDHPLHIWQAQELRSATFFNIKIGRVGGFSNAIKMQSMKEAGDSFWVGGLLEGPVGLAANLALAQLPNFGLPVDFMDFLWLMPRMLGYLKAPLFNRCNHRISPNFVGVGLNGNIDVSLMLKDAVLVDTIK